MFQDDIQMTESEAKELTKEYINEFGWKAREQGGTCMITDEQYKAVDDRIKKCFKDDFNFVGNIPYVSFYNLLGIRQKLLHNDEDAMVGVLGAPGRGKSSWAMTCARFMDSTFSNDRTIFTFRQFREFLMYATREARKIAEAQKNGENYKNELSGKAIVLDEGLYMMFSGDANSKQGKYATKLFSIIRALNLFIIVNITNFKRMNKGVTEGRFAGLFGIPKRSVLKFYSRKRADKIRNKAGELVYPSENFIDSTGYIDRDCVFWKEYYLKKTNFLQNTLKDIEKQIEETEKEMGSIEEEEEIQNSDESNNTPFQSEIVQPKRGRPKKKK